VKQEEKSVGDLAISVKTRESIDFANRDASPIYHWILSTLPELHMAIDVNTFGSLFGSHRRSSESFIVERLRRSYTAGGVDIFNGIDEKMLNYILANH
jgi:hypothetical protein